MDGAYQPEAWKDFYVMLGGSIAALTGLLFVATSLHVAEIGRTPHFRVRAFGNTFTLVGHLINSAVVLTPQPVSWLGIELALFNTFLFFIVRCAFTSLGRGRTRKSNCFEASSEHSPHYLAFWAV